MITNPSVNSNDTVYQITEEASLRVPYSLASTRLYWRYKAVNTFKDFGGKITTVARNTINNTRQQLKGTVTGVEATGGFNTDLTQYSQQRDIQGFFYNDADTRTFMSTIDDLQNVGVANFATAPAINSDGNLTAVFGGVSTNYLAAGTLLAFRDWTIAGNNTLAKVATTTDVAGITIITPALTTEATNGKQKVRVVGFEFAASDLALTVVGNDLKLTSTAAAWAHVAPRIGEFLFIGGDGSTSFAASGNVPFFGRVNFIDPANGYVLLDMTTGTQVADPGTGKTIRVFGGTNFRNGKKRRSYTQTRIYPDYVETVGGSATSYANAEHIVGAIPDAMTINIKQKTKIDVDMSYVAMDSLQDGKGVSSGIPYTVGNFVNEPDEDEYNTSTSIYMMRMSIIDPAVLNPTPYFAYATDVKLDIKNNVSPNDAIGIVGAFDANVGNFEVAAAITAYFASVHAITAMRQNKSIGLQIIGAQANAGVVFDMPLLTFAGGMPTVDKDKPVMMDLTSNGAKSSFGYTMAAMFFDYLPTVAMPV